MVYITERILFSTTLLSFLQILLNQKMVGADNLVFSDVFQKNNKDMYLVLLSDNSDRRIIGDKFPKYEDWLFMVLLTNLDETKICGGTLIKENFVLTSAWCITENESCLPKIFVSYNLHWLKQQDLVCTYGQPVVHPEYRKEGQGVYVNDVGLIRLDVGVGIPAKKLVKLPQSNPDGKNTKTTRVASWAVNKIVFPGGSSANTEIHFNSRGTLYEVEQTFTNVQHCVTLLGIPPNKAENFICTKTHKTTVPNNQLYGEGGSPLISNHEQIGIATGPSYRSTLEKCGLSIWTNVHSYLPWIRCIMAKSPEEDTPRGHSILQKWQSVCSQECDPNFKDLSSTRGKDSGYFTSAFSKFLSFGRTGSCFPNPDDTESSQTNIYSHKDRGFFSPTIKSSCKKYKKSSHPSDPCDSPAENIDLEEVEEDEENDDEDSEDSSSKNSEDSDSNYCDNVLKYAKYDLSKKPVCVNTTINPEDLLPLLDDRHHLMNIFQIQIGITIFFCFLLCFKVCG